MRPLIVSMVNEQPELRPSMGAATLELDKALSALPWWKLRARLRKRKDGLVFNLLKDVRHVFRTVFYLILFLPAVPVPPPALEDTAVESGRSSRLVAGAKGRLPWPRKPSTVPSP